MKIPEKIKLNIQCFVYFLFKGTMDPRLIVADFNYLSKLLDRKDLLFNCFEIFTYAIQARKDVKPDRLVADYILALHDKIDTDTLRIADIAKEFNKNSTSYWGDFLTLAKWFCYNSFPDPLNEDYIKRLDGSGCDAVPTFAMWTNVVEIDEAGNVLNSGQALTRANERIKYWDKHPVVPFEDWELEQEIY